MEWSFKKAITIQTYSFCDPIPVPINIVSFMPFKCCGWPKCLNRGRNGKQRAQKARVSLLLLLKIEYRCSCLSNLKCNFEIYNLCKDSIIYEVKISCSQFQEKGLKVVLEHLESLYFAEYGYLFPLTGRKDNIYVLQDYIECPKKVKNDHETIKLMGQRKK